MGFAFVFSTIFYVGEFLSFSSGRCKALIRQTRFYHPLS
ncbi:hypothetical protein C4K31_3158 [Pseudomonas chlororaphis subsp. piscium]|nr:hypothetical protein C4K31_3158 [Pseudomonas chlororaphis subsp. piscium]